MIRLEQGICRSKYRMRLAKWFLLLVVVGEMCLAARTSGHRYGKFQSTFSSAPFDPGVTSLPPRFPGNDPKAVYDSLFAIQQKAEKSEFESTAQYRERLRQTNTNTPLVGTLSLDSTYAFRITSSQIETKYDADAQQLTITIRIGPVVSNDPRMKTNKILRRLEILHDVVSERAYEATNAFGAKMNVQSTLVDSYNVALSGLQVPNGFDETSLAISLPPQEAMRAKPNVAGLVAVKLDPRPPYFTAEETSYGRATYEFPYEYTTNSRYILGRTIDIWFFNEQDGRILCKFSESPNSAMELAKTQVMKQITIVLEIERNLFDALDALMKSNPKHRKQRIPHDTCQLISSLTPPNRVLTDLLNKYILVGVPIATLQQAFDNDKKLLNTYGQLRAMNFSDCPGIGL